MIKWIHDHFMMTIVLFQFFSPFVSPFEKNLSLFSSLHFTWNFCTDIGLCPFLLMLQLKAFSVTLWWIFNLWSSIASVLVSSIVVEACRWAWNWNKLKINHLIMSSLHVRQSLGNISTVLISNHVLTTTIVWIFVGWPNSFVSFCFTLL